MNIKQLKLNSTDPDEMVQELLAFGKDDDVYILYFVTDWIAEKYKIDNTTRVMPLAKVLKNKDSEQLWKIACKVAGGYNGLFRLTLE